MQILFPIRVADYQQEYVVQQGQDISASPSELQARTLKSVLYLPDTMFDIVAINTQDSDIWQFILEIPNDLQRDVYVMPITNYCDLRKLRNTFD
jgi:hypothetical protein